MPSLWLPPGAGEDMLEHQRSAAARTIVGDFDKRLKTIDQRLGVCFVDHEDPNGALRIGFWHIYRRNPDATLTWWEISGPDGEFMEPSDRVLDKFRELDAATNADMQKPDFFRRQQEARERVVQARKDKLAEENQAKLKELADFEFRVQVPVTPDGRGRLRGRKNKRR